METSIFGILWKNQISALVSEIIDGASTARTD